jgi:hypothetical protein
LTELQPQYRPAAKASPGGQGRLVELDYEAEARTLDRPVPGPRITLSGVLAADRLIEGIRVSAFALPTGRPARIGVGDRIA